METLTSTHIVQQQESDESSTDIFQQRSHDDDSSTNIFQQHVHDDSSTNNFQQRSVADSSTDIIQQRALHRSSHVPQFFDIGDRSVSAQTDLTIAPQVTVIPVWPPVQAQRVRASGIVRSARSDGSSPPARSEGARHGAARGEARGGPRLPLRRSRERGVHSAHASQPPQEAEATLAVSIELEQPVQKSLVPPQPAGAACPRGATAQRGSLHPVAQPLAAAQGPHRDASSASSGSSARPGAQAGRCLQVRCAALEGAGAADAPERLRGVHLSRPHGSSNVLLRRARHGGVFHLGRNSFHLQAQRSDDGVRLSDLSNSQNERASPSRSSARTSTSAPTLCLGPLQDLRNSAAAPQ